VDARNSILFPLQLSNRFGDLPLPYDAPSGFGQAFLEQVRGLSDVPVQGLSQLEQAVAAESNGNFQEAALLFFGAIHSGLDDWHVAWALAKAAQAARNFGLLETACAGILKIRPTFFYARELPRHARGYYAQLAQDEVIEAYFLQNPPRHRFFVEVGAFDGVHFSNARRLHETYGWSGLCVEPVAENFEKLTRNYRGSNVICELAAVSPQEGQVEMYVSSFQGCPDWGSDLASMSDRRSELWLRPYQLKWTTQKVAAKTLARILSEHQVQGVGLLSIDAENHDLEVLQSLDTKQHRPQLIVVEYGGQRKGILEWARRESYGVHHDNGQDWFLASEK
jgi:FkbM family methyltransferase